MSVSLLRIVSENLPLPVKKLLECWLSVVLEQLDHYHHHYFQPGLVSAKLDPSKNMSNEEFMKIIRATRIISLLDNCLL